MSRINKYKESIIKFLNANTNNEFDNDLFKAFVSNYNFFIPIISLTIQYNIDTNKRNISGYYIAILVTLIEFINYLKDKKYDDEYTNVMNSVKKLTEKMKTLNKNANDFINKNFYVYLDKVIKKYEFPVTDNKLIYSAKYNFDDVKLQKKYDEMMVIDYNHIMFYINEVYVGLCYIGILFSVQKNDIDKYKKIIQLFGLIIKIDNDFKKFMEDIKNNENKICLNMLVNIGIQKTYNLYLESKSSLIEELIKCKLYSHTIKEIMDKIENNINNVINNTNVTIESTHEKI